MNIIFNLTRQYESHGLLVLNRLVRLGDNVEKVLILTNEYYDWKAFREWCENYGVCLNIHLIKYLKDVNLNDRFDSIIYGRLFLNETNFFNRGLYLDVDIWPRSGLSDLWSKYDKDLVYAARDNNSSQQVKRFATERNVKLKEYFNAGVILFNDISALDNKFVDMQKLIYKKFKYHDQDILNLVLSETFSALPSKYNHMSLAKSDDAILVHFAHNKPWDYPCLYQNAREYMAELELRLGPIECTKLSVLRVFRLLVARYFG